MPRTTRASTKKSKQPKASRKNNSPPTKPSSKDAPSSLHKTPAHAAAAVVDTAPTTTADAADTGPTPPTDADDHDHDQTAATVLALLLPATALLADLSARLETALAAVAEGAASEADAVDGVLAGFVVDVGALDEVHGAVAGLLEERGRGCGWDGEELGRERERWERVVGGVVGCVGGWGEDVSEGEGEGEEEWVGEGEDEGDEDEWGGKGRRKEKRKRGKGKDNGKVKGAFGEEDEKVAKKRKTEGSAGKGKAAERNGKGGKKGNGKEYTVAAQVEEMKEEEAAKVEANEEDVRQQKRDSIDEFEIDWDI